NATPRCRRLRLASPAMMPAARSPCTRTNAFSTAASVLSCLDGCQGRYARPARRLELHGWWWRARLRGRQTVAGNPGWVVVGRDVIRVGVHEVDPQRSQQQQEPEPAGHRRSLPKDPSGPKYISPSAPVNNV